jgi:Protein of unknown function (DUF3108)
MPWHGLIVALLLALLAHTLAFLMIDSRFSWRFQQPNALASINTRLLEPLPAAVQPAPPAQTPAQPESEAAPKAAAIPAALPQPSAAPNNESSEPSAKEESAPPATETIATITPDASATLATLTSTQALSAANQPASPSLKLQYPPSVELQFDGTVMRKGTQINGSGALKWQTDGRDYELSLEASALLILSRVEKSVGQLTPQGLAPLRYSSSGTGRAEQATHFRAELGKIQFSNNKPEAPLLVGAQDQLSAFIQLAGIVGGDQERYRFVNRIPMQVAGLNAADLWEFNIQGFSDITVPAATMQALKITRTPRNEYDQKLEIWLSPQLGYLPIRIRQSSSTTPEQDFTDLVLRKLP